MKSISISYPIKFTIQMFKRTPWSYNKSYGVRPLRGSFEIIVIFIMRVSHHRVTDWDKTLGSDLWHKITHPCIIAMSLLNQDMTHVTDNFKWEWILSWPVVTLVVCSIEHFEAKKIEIESAWKMIDKWRNPSYVENACFWLILWAHRQSPVTLSNYNLLTSWRS